ncbi:hypothetical protein CANARDRAFT_211993 [[Candida] arabinofermentans NRRL YB-2248]|uniref:Amino acid permease/ SLC12A domain-containing protein n=1 Tax=[Candida] arabinofermentans NRRL YB-2248 TaxID=983967 RepID=A0A1E4T1U5_9ASCO|nr:hypothetical protein CANARDRAFT_211993 [[Candida] arabinofermentans NRRL YB-2248]
MSSINPITSRLNAIKSQQSAIREIDANEATGDELLLAEIGYKQELRRSFKTYEVFGISYSIMGILPGIASMAGTGLLAGPAGFVWSWAIASFFICTIALGLSELASAIPTSGGLYYWTHYYAPPNIRVPLSFVIGLSNSMALCAGVVSVAYGNAEEILAAIYIQLDGDFEITTGKTYGIFAACVVTQTLCTCLSSKNSARLQTVSSVLNTILFMIFFIALPIGTARTRGSFNSRGFIFGEVQNHTDWNKGWEFMLAMMSAVWSIGAFDSCIHCSEECENATFGVPIGIISSVSIVSLICWFCIVCLVACMNPDVSAVLATDTSFPFAQIIYDSLGKKWAIGIMALTAVCQWLCAASILTALSRQVWAFARDNGLPFHEIVKVVDKRTRAPLRAVVFAACISLCLGCLCLAGSAASNALFSLCVSGNYVSWCTPILLRLTTGKSRFRPGRFYLGDFWSPLISWTGVTWGAFILVLCMFPSSKAVDKTTMNYTVVISCGCWILSVIYFFTYKYKFYHGPRSNLTPEDNIEGVATEVVLDSSDDNEKRDFV